jgi:MFS family permease
MSTTRDDSGGGDANLSQASLLHQQAQEAAAATTGVRVVYVSPELRERFEFRRLLSIACGILGCCSIGATYSVGILSNGMQRVFGLSQDSITTIVFVGFLTAYLAFPAGWIMDVYGPKAVMIIATTLSVLGWALFALDFAGMLADGSVAFLAFICALFFWTPGSHRPSSPSRSTASSKSPRTAPPTPRPPPPHRTGATAARPRGSAARRRPRWSSTARRLPSSGSSGASAR